jgi:hypothetical protein
MSMQTFALTQKLTQRLKHCYRIARKRRFIKEFPESATRILKVLPEKSARRHI